VAEFHAKNPDSLQRWDEDLQSGLGREGKDDFCKDQLGMYGPRPLKKRPGPFITDISAFLESHPCKPVIGPTGLIILQPVSSPENNSFLRS
jgi:hypothetical protein